MAKATKKPKTTSRSRTKKEVLGSKKARINAETATKDFLKWLLEGKYIHGQPSPFHRRKGNQCATWYSYWFRKSREGDLTAFVNLDILRQASAAHKDMASQHNDRVKSRLVYVPNVLGYFPKDPLEFESLLGSLAAFHLSFTGYSLVTKPSAGTPDTANQLIDFWSYQANHYQHLLGDKAEPLSKLILLPSKTDTSVSTLEVLTLENNPLASPVDSWGDTLTDEEEAGFEERSIEIKKSVKSVKKNSVEVLAAEEGLGGLNKKDEMLLITLKGSLLEKRASLKDRVTSLLKEIEQVEDSLEALEKVKKALRSV